jgi:DNA-binding NarL/FixJ family response regulator
MDSQEQLMPTQVSSSSPTHRLLRVLIVDDMPQVRQDLRLLLQLSGELEIVGEAANGLEAIRQADALQPEVVVMDLEMPVLDGYEAARRIKTRTPACRVIALTVHGYEAARQKAIQAGVDVFLVKGAPVEALVSAILEADDDGPFVVGASAP